MPNDATTQVSSASATTGQPIPLSYGYVWATGKRSAYYMLQNTNNTYLDYTRVGIWLLGHGEWDGCNELWINDDLVWTSENDDPTQFHFHRGSDAPIAGGLTPSSQGPDQGMEVFWNNFPSAVQQLNYNRIAYYSIFRKQKVQFQTNDHEADPTQWTDVNPVGLWRALRTRLFDGSGNVTGYAFNTNPAWHFVDVLLRRKIMVDYNIDLNNGPDPLTTAVTARFNWDSIYTSAQYFDQLLTNGRRRFTGNYAFASQTSLQAVLEQILLCCRSYMQEYAGQIYLICDQPRPSYFTFNREHILPGSWEASDRALHTTANRYIAKFRDLLIPVAAEIASITCADHANPIVTTVNPHPFTPGDRICIGGTDTVYDGNWTVKSVPTGSNVTTLTLQSRGSNYPASVGAGGSIGLLYSRFANRAAEFWHKANQLARGAVGNGIPRWWNRVKQELDYATCTYDQASRITRYERDRQLGPDATPYVTPTRVKFRTSLFAKDASGNLAVSIQPGDVITLDDTVNYPYAGEYEVLEPLTVYPPTVHVEASPNSVSLQPAAQSGEIEFTLGPYSTGVFYDTSDDLAAGWPVVPGSDPGNDSSYTAIDLANGTLVFFTGALPSGGTFQLPSTGFNAGNVIPWAGPQGYFETGHPMHIIQLCDADANLKLTLNYEDGGENVWHGDVNYAAAAWRSSDVPTQSGAWEWLQLTLAGGEIILFGKAIVADGTPVPLPSGFTSAKMFAIAFPHDGVPTGNDAHWVGAYVDSSLIVHLNYKDGQGHVWHGNASVLVFAWQDNMSTVTTQSLGGATWAIFPLSTGMTVGVGCQLSMANGATFELPTQAGDGTSLQAIAASSGWDYPDNGHPAHGIGACYLDSGNVVHIQFEDGEGHVWYGAADIFAIFAVPAAGNATTIKIAPATVTLAPSAVQAFVATVSNNANTSVTWSVDGIVGGNTTVGTIDASGNYIAPYAVGDHTITATSVAVPTASASATVTISDNGSSSPNAYTNSPAVALTQPTATSIDLAAVAVTFGARVANYNARTFTIPVPGAPTWYYVTISDLAQTGDASATLPSTCQTSNALVGIAGQTYMGAILALPGGGAISMLAGGWPSPATFQVVP